MDSNLPRDSKGQLMSYAWPGGYPIFYLDNYNLPLCPDCAREEEQQAEEERHTYGIHWEGEPIICDDCGREIESAYGDPDQ